MTPVNTKDYKDTDFVLPCGPVELARRTIYLCNDMFERSNPWIWCVCFLKKPYPKWLELIAKWSHIMYQIGPWAREMENSKPLFSLKRGVFRNQRIILSYGSKMYQLKCVGTAHTVFYMESTLPWQPERKSRCPLSSVVHPRCTCFYSHADTSTHVVPLALYFWIHVFFLTWHSFVTLFVASLCLGALDWKPTESKKN